MVLFMPVTTMAESIMVLGDSISASYGMKVSQGWVTLLQNRLDEKNPGHVMHNESISGDTTIGGLARVGRALALHKPTVVIIELGVNDGLRGFPPEQIKENLVEIIHRARQAGAKVLLLSMKIPASHGKGYIDLVYNIYPQLAMEMGIPYVPFISGDAVLGKDMMQQDGLHPNVKGQTVIADKVWPALLLLLK